MSVADILNSKGTRVDTTHQGTTVLEAARKMAGKHIGSLIVLDIENKVAGIVSERDIVQCITQHDAGGLELPVGEVMTSKVISCKPDDDVKQVMKIMTRWHIRHLPVMAGDDLKGIISIGDVVENRLSDAQLEVEVLRDYARGH